MTKVLINPSSARAKIDMSLIRENFHPTLDKLRQYGTVSMKDAGFDWNSTVLEKGKGSAINFYLGNEYVENAFIQGRVHNGTVISPAIEVYGGSRNLGISSMTQDYVIRSLSDAMKIIRKVKLMPGTVFLPSGNQLPPTENSGDSGKELDDKRRKNFLMELTEGCEELILARLDRRFEDYTVAKMKSGWYIAYNQDYAEGPFIVTDLEYLLLPKTELIKTSSAIRFRRDARGDWPDKVRRFF